MSEDYQPGQPVMTPQGLGTFLRYWPGYTFARGRGCEVSVNGEVVALSEASLQPVEEEKAKGHMTGIIELLPKRLKSYRRERGLTLAQVTAHTGISLSFLSDIERGRTQPSLETLAKLAACYNTTVAELFIEADVQEYVKQVRVKMLSMARDEIEAEIEKLMPKSASRHKRKRVMDEL